MSRKHPPFEPGEVLGGLRSTGPISISGSHVVAVPAGGSGISVPGMVVAGGMGEVIQDPTRFQTAPPTAELPFEAEIKPGVSQAVKLSGREEIDERALQIVRTIPPVAGAIITTPFMISANDPKRIDSGLANRIYVMIQNMSAVVIWVDQQAAVKAAGTVGGAGTGYPLAASSASGAYNGSAIMFAAGPNVQFWAVPASGSGVYGVIIEAAR